MALEDLQKQVGVRDPLALKKRLKAGVRDPLALKKRLKAGVRDPLALKKLLGIEDPVALPSPLLSPVQPARRRRRRPEDPFDFFGTLFTPQTATLNPLSNLAQVNNV